MFTFVTISLFSSEVVLIGFNRRIVYARQNFIHPQCYAVWIFYTAGRTSEVRQAEG